MNVLITGANGFLGKYICRELSKEKILYVKFNRTDNLSEVLWDDITHVINCAAKTPGEANSLTDFWSSNIIFLEDLIYHSKNKVLIHFSSFSEFYKHENYQITKLIGTALISANGHLFKDYQIIPVPTLEDSILIKNLISKSKETPIVVDKLKYSYIQPEELAFLVVKSIKNSRKVNIFNSIIQKNLYEEVLKISDNNIFEGNVIDNSMLVNGQFFITSDLKGKI